MTKVGTMASLPYGLQSMMFTKTGKKMQKMKTKISVPKPRKFASGYFTFQIMLNGESKSTTRLANVSSN